MSTRPPVEELLRLAEAATPGPWHYICTGSEGGSLLPDKGRGRIARLTDFALSQINADGAYIAAANPSVVTALCQRVLELEAALEKVVNPDLFDGHYIRPDGFEQYRADLSAARSLLSSTQAGEGTDDRE